MRCTEPVGDTTPCHPERSEGARAALRPLRSLRSLWVTGGYVALLLIPTLAAAQVGHQPGKSPYRDIRPGHTLTPLVGLFRGGGGRFGIGPHDGTVFGARYDIRTSSALQLGV